ncbi:MAG: hypothetical protein H3C39_01180 [Flavobacteriia bacterium]|nr:hypothetical protein [Flavobacteriia bacterium]
MGKYLRLLILLIGGIAVGQRSFYKINKVCELDYDRQNKVIECYDVTNVSITRDYNNKHFAFFSGNQKTIIPFTTWRDIGDVIGYFYYETLVITIGLNDKRIPYRIVLSDEKNRIGRGFEIESWQQE